MNKSNTISLCSGSPVPAHHQRSTGGFAHAAGGTGSGNHHPGAGGRRGRASAAVPSEQTIHKYQQQLFESRRQANISCSFFVSRQQANISCIFCEQTTGGNQLHYLRVLLHFPKEPFSWRCRFRLWNKLYCMIIYIYIYI